MDDLSDLERAVCRLVRDFPNASYAEFAQAFEHIMQGYFDEQERFGHLRDVAQAAMREHLK